jgi:hypothetical protein
MGKKEEITDVISDKGIRELKVGTVLKFDYEGSPIYIKVTRKDTKNLRIWGEHLTLYDMDSGMSHYGHDVDVTNMDRVFCNDCQVEISQVANEDGEVKAAERAAEEEQVHYSSEEEAARRFTYELLGQDGTTKVIAENVPRKTVQDFYEILKCSTVELIHPAYYPGKYEPGWVVYGDENGQDNSENIRNPFMQVLEGDPAYGEPAEWDVVGNLILEKEVK